MHCKPEERWTRESVSGNRTPRSSVAATRTRLFVAISFRLPIPGKLVKPLLQPLAMRIFRQDARMLKLQTENIERFGGSSYKSTGVDVLWPDGGGGLRREPANDEDRQFVILRDGHAP